MPARPPGTAARTSGQAGCRELENEAWLLRCILDFFRSRREIAAVLTFVDRCLEADSESKRVSGSPGDEQGGGVKGLAEREH